jgi:hypothetical protein
MESLVVSAPQQKGELEAQQATLPQLLCANF